MSEPTYLVDTTILVDATLKPGSQAASNKAAIRAAKTLLPVYAIKEMQQGALAHFVSVYNKLSETGSFTKTLAWAQKVAATPRRNRASTILEALVEMETLFGALSATDLPSGNSLDSIHARFIADQLLTHIRRAWKKRRTLCREVVHELACFPEDPPELEAGLLPVVRGCRKNAECDLASHLPKNGRMLNKLRDVSRQQGTDEGKRRNAALRKLAKGDSLDLVDCRNLGDAVFSLLAPAGATVLTTNLRDHKPLAQALGKRAAGIDALVSTSPAKPATSKRSGQPR